MVGILHGKVVIDGFPASEFDGWDPNGKVVIDGFQKLIDHLSDGLNIKLNSIVENLSINQTNSCKNFCENQKKKHINLITLYVHCL